MSAAKKKAGFGLTRPSRAAEKHAEGESRLHVDIPASVHKALRVRVAERGVSIRDYILELLAADGIGPNP